MPGRNIYPRAERLTRKSEYRFVFENGEKLVGRHFICYLVRGEGKESKLGFAVSRKVGNAVTRNRVKRHIREFYRTRRRGFTEPVTMVVVARWSSAGLSCPESAAAITRLLERGGIWHG